MPKIGEISYILWLSQVFEKVNIVDALGVSAPRVCKEDEEKPLGVDLQ